MSRAKKYAKKVVRNVIRICELNVVESTEADLAIRKLCRDMGWTERLADVVAGCRIEHRAVSGLSVEKELDALTKKFEETK